MTGKPRRGRPFEDQAGDVLGRRVDLHHEDPLALGLEEGQDRVVVAEQHVVVQVLVDPALHGLLDVAEVDQHPPTVQRSRPPAR